MLQLCNVCREEIRVSVSGGGVVAGCGCGETQPCSRRDSALRAHARLARWKELGIPHESVGVIRGGGMSSARRATGNASGEVVVPKPRSFDGEQRTQAIADRIADCAEFLHLAPCDLSRPDFVKYAKLAWPTAYADIVRDLSLLGGYDAIRATYYPPQPTDRAETLYQIRQHAKLNRRLGATAISDDLHFKQIEEWAAKVFNAREPVKAPAYLKRGRGDEIERELILLLGDQHIGANINGKQTGGPDYGPVEEARSHAQCVRRLLDWKPEHRRKTGLTVCWLGDLHDGDIHDPRSRAEMWEQKCRAIWVGTAFVERVAPEFLHVRNHCYTGNHDRDTNRHPERATSAKFDSHATVSYFAMKMATRGMPNVSWDIPMSAFSTFEIFGHHYYATHGDTDLHTGNPGQGIPVGKLNAEANEINARLDPSKRISVFFAAHAHTYANARLGAGAEIFINGPMTPLNSYAHSISVYHGNSSQTMIEAVPGHPVGDRCPIDLDEKVYADKSLDKLIPPFKEF
jgi:hypothetical protein